MSPEEVYCKQARIPLVAELASRKLLHFELASRVLNLKSSDFFWSTVWTPHAHQQADGGPCAAEGPVGGCSALRRRQGLELDPPSTVQQRAGACHVILSGIEDEVAPASAALPVLQ